MNAYQAQFGGGDSDAFVAEFNPTRGTLTYASYLGGSSADIGQDIALDTYDNIYLTGRPLPPISRVLTPYRLLMAAALMTLSSRS